MKPYEKERIADEECVGGVAGAGGGDTGISVGGAIQGLEAVKDAEVAMARGVAKPCAECGKVVVNWCYDYKLRALCQKCAGGKAGDVTQHPPVFKTKGSSITLWGSGDRSGRDVNNAMGLSEMYRVILGV